MKKFCILSLCDIQSQRQAPNVHSTGIELAARDVPCLGIAVAEVGGGILTAVCQTVRRT